MTLRQFLRDATRDQHEMLDAQLDADDLHREGGYARFLTIQLLARRPIENWVASHCPAEIAPPPTVPDLLADLSQLGDASRQSDVDFGMAPQAEPIGLAWALGGSQLGNRSILARLPGRDKLPTQFLESEATIGFWHSLRPKLEQTFAREYAERAALAAESVFATFLTAHRRYVRELAA